MVDIFSVHPTWTEACLPDPIPVVFFDGCGALGMMLSAFPMAPIGIHFDSSSPSICESLDLFKPTANSIIDETTRCIVTEFLSFSSVDKRFDPVC